MSPEEYTEDMKARKDALRRRITGLLYDFQVDTGLDVTDIRMRRPFANDPQYFLIDLTVEVP